MSTQTHSFTLDLPSNNRPIALDNKVGGTEGQGPKQTDPLWTRPPPVPNSSANDDTADVINESQLRYGLLDLPQHAAPRPKGGMPIQNPLTGDIYDVKDAFDQAATAPA